MVLNARQVRRFYRLFDLFMVYAAQRLGMLGTLLRRDGSMNDTGVMDVAKAVWSTDENRQLVNDYVTENPNGLGSSDLREVRAWSEAIYADFGAVRDGSNVFFCLASTPLRFVASTARSM